LGDRETNSPCSPPSPRNSFVGPLISTLARRFRAAHECKHFQLKRVAQPVSLQAGSEDRVAIPIFIGPIIRSYYIDPPLTPLAPPVSGRHVQISCRSVGHREAKTLPGQFCAVVSLCGLLSRHKRSRPLFSLDFPSLAPPQFLPLSDCPRRGPEARVCAFQFGSAPIRQIAAAAPSHPNCQASPRHPLSVAQ